jgi:hypothetical protein
MMARMDEEARKAFIRTIDDFRMARAGFRQAVEDKLILGNDNHVGDIGEFWVRDHFEAQGWEVSLPATKTSPHDLELRKGTETRKVSVKTMTLWSQQGIGTQVIPDGANDLLCCVLLGEDLRPVKMASITFEDLKTQAVFLENEENRRKKGTAAFPRYGLRWWGAFLDNYLVKP